MENIYLIKIHSNTCLLDNNNFFEVENFVWNKSEKCQSEKCQWAVFIDGGKVQDVGRLMSCDGIPPPQNRFL